MTKNQNKFSSVLSDIKTVLECLAIVSAGVWALIHFNILEVGEAKSNFNGSVNLKLNKWLEGKSSCIYDFEVNVENSGKQTQKIDHTKYTVCRLKPPLNQPIGSTGAHEISNECEAPATEVKMAPDFIMGQTGDVYPGEKKQTIYSFVAPAAEWPWQVEATGYADKEEKIILFKGADWQFCEKPSK